MTPTATPILSPVRTMRGPHHHEALGAIEGPRARLDALREGEAFAQRRGIEEFIFVLGAGTVDTLVDLGSYQEAMALAAGLVPRLEAAEDVFDLFPVRSSLVRVLTRRAI